MGMSETTPRPRLILWLAIAVAFALGAAGAAALLVNISERKQEARVPTVRVAAVSDETEDPALWGKNYPLEYDSYRKTVDMMHTRYGGSEAMPRTASADDPRA